MKEQYYSYDDVCLIPRYTTLNSRQDASTKCKLFDLELNVPFISANMDTITGAEMAGAMWYAGGIGALHRFNSIEKACNEYTCVIENNAQCLVSIGVNNNFKERALGLYNTGARYFVVDIAHGHSEQMKKALTWLKEKLSDIHIIAGNVASAEAVYDLATWGADIVKVGVGPGSVCKTRIVTGHGIPQFSCLLECAAAADEEDVKLIADGGIKTSGDIVKAFVAGADYIMMGSLLSGTQETPGRTLVKDGELYKEYRGMASNAAQSGYKGENVRLPAEEGVCTLVHQKSGVGDVIEELRKGLQSGMSYCNARTLRDINLNALWSFQTANGLQEAKPHILNNI